MEGTLFLGQYLIWMMILLAQLHGYKSCIQKERTALLELKKYLISTSREGAFDHVLTTWTNDRNINCCHWKEIKCNLTSGRVTRIAFGNLYLKESTLLNLSLLHPFEEVQSLNLSGSNINGLFDDVEGVCELKNMQELYLSYNYLGQFPLCLTSLTGLRVLDLSSNQLTGKLPSALANLESLEYLSLFDNNFEGHFSLGWLANLSKLTVFKLSSKANSLQVESESSWKPKFQLSFIVLRSCNMEKVPHFLLHQNDLRQVDLSDNNISGKFPSWLLANNTKLESLLLQNNSLTSFQLPKAAHNLLFLEVSVNEFNQLLPDNIGWILPRLKFMNLANNSFQGYMPSSFGNMEMIEYMDISRNGFDGDLASSLGNMEKIEYMDISHNNFHGKLPKRFLNGCYSLVILKLSHNKLSGEIFPESTNFTRVSLLSMDNNLFTGKIGQGLRRLRSLRELDISNNKLTGVIPSWIGELPSLNALLLPNNSLEGDIPVSLFNTSYLKLIDLSANNLSGGIPPYVSSEYGAKLFLQDNNLSGVIPETLLTHVDVLDLRNNRLSGNIPEFTSIQEIRILLLRGNNLTGHIPRHLCANIQLLDLANNRLNGSISSCLSNNTSLGLGNEDYTSYADAVEVFPDSDTETDYTEDVDLKYRRTLGRQNGTSYDAATKTKIEFATKHRYDAYKGGNLELLFGIDLSENELSGEIPVELGDLLQLLSLNLSHNNLSGVIPESFSRLENVESLDLSFNRLQGRIPPQLTDLSSLAVFNVSYNNLSGVIPQGKQFNTFDTRSYLGNPLFCGKPTNLSCESNSFQEPDHGVEADEFTTDMGSFYWSFAAAYVTILIGILASLSFDSPWSRAWFYIVDTFVLKVRNLLC
ncbi:LRR receptor-like serine/threonine-protein kinase GSO2 [Arabidopsis lyrata subsp. lyrata]|uniref:LRR receptor-like serine/threonine-protein kinase GSO2 n=1 Tax=Arabidopsis lyrata subsp. lyrata TaxID=81972 RepID=UPI000A29BF27|nr:LRR receptor-like serine/threonine-protein kinase GSO2 [Arabidopsis lyrata subsp. lyrata]|eukprot:XP_020890605.1 LRR receptor-like serine/threonine-protein kinase GSO2 [Arabidopsis lyrata subsp. lyrata]